MLQFIQDYLGDKYNIITFIMVLLTFFVSVNFAIQVIKILLCNKKYACSQKILSLKTSYVSSVVIAAFFCAILIMAWLKVETLLYKALMSLIICEVIFAIFLSDKSKSGISAEGLFVSGRFYEWFTIHDYYIDKSRKKIVFSNNIKGGLTLKGLTVPLKYAKDDESKLENYLENQNSKFLKRIIIR